MKINNSIKRYWARTGPNSVFGSDWSDRADFSDTEAEQRFNQVWASDLYPAIQSGKRISAVVAKAKIPDDRRQDYFDAHQEHREFQLGGTTLLAQIDIKDNRLTQMWHLNNKGGTRVHSSSPVAPPTDFPAATDESGGDRLTDLANRTGLPREELAEALAGVLTCIILGIK